MSFSVTDLPANMQSKIRVEGAHWIWTGALQTNGYGSVGFKGKTYLTHRAVWELLVGPIPEGLVIDHVKQRGCGIRACCNPACLEPVTTRVNNQRGPLAMRTHCPAGHKYAGDNLRMRVKSNGWINRTCLACEKVRRAEGVERRRIAGVQLTADDPRHGKASAYSHHGCRCAACSAANTERLRRWRASKAA